MKRLFAIMALCLGLCTLIDAQPYAVSAIAKELLPYASAVVRTDETTVTIKDNDNVLYHIKYAITVLNKNGADDAELSIWHNKQKQVKSIKGIIYDELGKPIKKFGEGDFKDDAAYDGFSLFNDERTKYYNPAATTYPYTVEYEYELKANQTLNIMPWFPNYANGVSVEHSSYTLNCKPDNNIRYKETNYTGAVVTGADDKGMKTYNWYVANVKARRSEPYSPNRLSYVTSVRIAPQVFSYENTKGSYTDWNDLGKWIYDKLLTGRSQLPPETVNQVKEMTEGITDPKLKARKIYEFMQRKTRYVSIQIGIGGYQPFKASEVDQLSYGDCKGLVNYTQALLKAADINSYYCVVKSGSEKMSLKNDFASMDQADHIILCLPFKSDTTWLECTSKSMPFGYLSNFTDDRWVLACTPEGGKLLHTPKYTKDDNTAIRKAEFVMSANGMVKGNILTKYNCTQFDEIDDVAGEPTLEQTKHIKSYYPINNLEVEYYKLTPVKRTKPLISEVLKFSALEYAATEDDKLSFTVNKVNRISGPPREVRNRSNPLFINRGYTDDDEIVYTLPAGYHADRALLDVKLDKKFGSYHASVDLKGNQLIYNRKMQLIDGTYSKEDYNEMVEFYQTITDADNYTMTLIKDK